MALHIESIRMRGVLDTDALWDQERGAIEQEVAQDLSNPTVRVLYEAAGDHVSKARPTTTTRWGRALRSTRPPATC